MNNPQRMSVVVPIYWPDRRWPEFLHQYLNQTLQPSAALVMSSAAKPSDLSLAEASGFRCLLVSPEEFDHGATRQAAVDIVAPNNDIVIFLTQDACLANPESFERLVDAFSDPSIGAAWGRQLPHLDATPIASHARHFNYPSDSRIVDSNDIPSLGIKVAFCSNSFAAYRLSALKEVGGFPSPTPLGEDMAVAGRLIKAGYRIAYVAEAMVHHSHNLTPIQELRRYFDTGAFHALNPWLLDHFGSSHGEGLRFIVSEIRYLASNSPISIPRALLGDFCKYIGYQLGRRSPILPSALKSALGMNKTYWNKLHATRSCLSDR